MSDESDYEQSEDSGGGGDMVEHIQKYKNYIQGLKRGQSSGISAAFGRASDLLPPDVLEVAPPKGATVATVGHELDERVFAAEYNQEALRTAVEGLILSSAEQLEDHVGAIVMTAEGPSEVVNCFVEEGQLKFMLANLDVIDEDEFNRSRQESEGELESDDTTYDDNESSVADFEDQMFEEAEHALSSDEVKDDEVEVEDEALVEEDYFQPQQQEVEPEPTPPPMPAPAPAMRHVHEEQRENVRKFGDTIESVIFDEERPFDLVVTTPSGSVLWGVHYDNLEIDQVVMSDGTQIRRAEGRHEYVMVQRASDRLHPRIYILSGVMVDPITGNVYAEANEGGYTAAFLNNGWQIHQYRSRDSKDTFFVKEPARPGRPGAFMEVINLALDVQSGEVSYETVDSSATVTLKSRRL